MTNEPCSKAFTSIKIRILIDLYRDEGIEQVLGRELSCYRHGRDKTCPWYTYELPHYINTSESFDHKCHNDQERQINSFEDSIETPVSDTISTASDPSRIRLKH